jgi:hypothetical protein
MMKIYSLAYGFLFFVDFHLWIRQYCTLLLLLFICFLTVDTRVLRIRICGSLYGNPDPYTKKCDVSTEKEIQCNISLRAST